MTVPPGPELEDALRRALSQLAPDASPPLLDRTLASVADTAQRPASASRVSLSRAAWTWVAASVVIVAGIVAGIIIGNAAPEFVGDASGSLLASPSMADTPTPGSPEASAASIPPIPPGTWERIDLPDPAPDTFTSTQASDIVVLNGTYVAVGSFQANCASDIYETPAGCDRALSAVPSAQAAVVWLSDDARTWEQLPYQPEFRDAGMEHAATDGERIVVSSGRSRVVWVSDDGRTWERITRGGLLPEQLVATANGFVGVRQTDDGPQFVASEDGSTWRALTSPGDQGPGEVMRLAVGLDGMTVMAVGVTYVSTDLGDDREELTITGTSWLSRDGVNWERAAANDGHEGAWMSAAAETDSGWVAVGLDQTIDAEPADEMAVWTSPDGLAWTRVPGASIERVFDGYADDVAWTGEHVVATGSVSGEGGSTIAFWLSPDGSTWDVVERDVSRDKGSPIRIIALDGWVLTSGGRSASPDHSIGVIWLGSP